MTVKRNNYNMELWGYAIYACNMHLGNMCDVMAQRKGQRMEPYWSKVSLLYLK